MARYVFENSLMLSASVDTFYELYIIVDTDFHDAQNLEAAAALSFNAPATIFETNYHEWRTLS